MAGFGLKVGLAGCTLGWLDFFPLHERVQARFTFVGMLKSIIGQRLMWTKDGKGRVAACEIMVATGRIMDPDQTGQIQTTIAEGEYYGMQTFDQVLVKLIEEDRVTYKKTLQATSHLQDFRLIAQSPCLGMAP